MTVVIEQKYQNTKTHLDFIMKNAYLSLVIHLKIKVLASWDWRQCWSFFFGEQDMH